ncbi:hypothetical protein HPB50_015600 [Hyalomma asiaticum]|uniref:Uncharacterized protein n=1 Tax=Hyalomma asiaticum TaxID=266040 RepID=A0ACB7SY82_HYAAI|nr:hypothetical protein HPB50_015600 [Hyalomma asiaticum]
MLHSASESVALFADESVGGSDEAAPPCVGPQLDEANQGPGRRVSRAERNRRGRGISTATQDESSTSVVCSGSRNAAPDEGVAEMTGGSDSSGRTGRTSDGGSSSTSGPAETGTGNAAAANLSCWFCHEEASSGPGEPLFRCPCRCPGTFVHRSCLEELLYFPGPEDGAAACPTCGAHYPVRRCTKPLWRWFWEEETCEDATLFLANLLFSVGNVGVLAMAWLYALFEYNPETWPLHSLLVLALFLFSVLWVAFGCARFYVVSISLVRWRRQNTTLQVLLTDKSVAQA